MTDNKKISLTVQHAYSNESGYAFFSSDDRGKLGISAGDYVKISGGKTALARAHFHPDVHPGKIVLTKDVRLKAVANFDSPVEIEKITPLYADKITIQPRDEGVKVKDSEIFRDTLQGELVYKGYEFNYSYYYGFVVSDVSPSEYAIVTSATQFIYKDRVHKEDEESDRPEVHYEDIGGLGRELSQVREMIEYPLRHPEVFEKLGIEPPKGVLLYGPPGTGKTLIAKAVAHNAGVPFLRLAGSELVHKYIGEGAQLVRDLFSMARELAEENNGVVVFIDEIDAVGSMRTNDGTSGSAEVQRTLMQLLAEMDGFNNRGNIRIIAATNRPDMLDAALLRPGRFDRLIKIPAPDAEARQQIFHVHTRKMEEAGALENINYRELVTLSDGLTGAEIEAICREAGMLAIRNDSDKITAEDFLAAIRKVRHSEKDESWRDVMYL